MENNFKTNARIVFEMGKESIENKTIALSEIIKNAYDANATKCDVIVEENGEPINLFQNTITSIEIVDNGIGMSKEDLINNWLVLGTNNKKIQKTNSKNNIKRIPVGEKGIGRFAINKIGNFVTIITKKENSLAYALSINFGDFSEDKMLEDVKIEVNEYTGINNIETASGTRIIIKDLCEKWTEDDLKEVYSEILKLQSPFKDESDIFEVNFLSDSKNLFENYLTTEKILEYSLWNAEIVVNPNSVNGNMLFEFTPYEMMKGFSKKREIVKIDYKEAGKKLSIIDISKYNIGPIKIRLYAFHRTSRILNMMNLQRKVLTDYLDENGGVRVYRSGQRIYNYGSRGEDWLGLNLKRLNSPGRNLSKNILIGIVDLDASKSSDLIEKTNREGFIENEAFIEFRKIVSMVIDNFALAIKPYKDKIKESIDRNMKKEKVDENISELVFEVENLQTSNVEEKNAIIKKLKTLSSEIQESKSLYLSIASSSLEFNMLFHDIDKHIKNLLLLVKKDGTSIDDIKKGIVSISDLINAQSDLIRKRDFSVISSNVLKDKFINYSKYRLKYHNVSCELICDDIKINCIESQILRLLVNFLDNSIYWLGLQNNKKVYLRITEEDNFPVIYFADNGPGFGVDDPSILFQPFVTKKTDGLGLGLYIANEIVSMHNGKLEYDFDYTSIPKEYKGVKYRIELGD